MNVIFQERAATLLQDQRKQAGNKPVPIGTGIRRQGLLNLVRKKFVFFEILIPNS